MHSRIIPCRYKLLNVVITMPCRFKTKLKKEENMYGIATRQRMHCMSNMLHSRRRIWRYRLDEYVSNDMAQHFDESST